MDRRVGGFLLLIVFARGFAQLGAGSGDIKNIIGNLKGEANSFAVGADSVQVPLRSCVRAPARTAAENAPVLRSECSQRARAGPAARFRDPPPAAHHAAFESDSGCP
jgi:hypothetical protein